MKALFTSTLIALVTLGAAPVQAAGDHAGHGMAMQATASTEMQMVDGVVKKVDKSAGKVTLSGAEIIRYGVIHRNTFVNAPAVVDPYLRPRASGRGDLFLAGQMTGVEGYMESTAMGLAAALNLAAVLAGLPLPEWPRETAVGSLLHYLQNAVTKTFQPINANLGLFPPLPERVKDKRTRAAMIGARALTAAKEFLEQRRPTPDGA